MLYFSNLFIEVAGLEPDDVSKSLKQAAIWGAGALLPSFVNKQQDNIEHRKKLNTLANDENKDEERKKAIKRAAITGLSSAAAGALGYLAGK